MGLIRLVSKYWMRLSIIGSVMEIEEGVILRGRRSRWITLFEVSAPRNSNPIIAYYFFK